MKLIILDRDGVVNEDSDEYIKSPDELHPFESSLKAIARLNQAGYKVAIATNQSGIGRGLFTESVLDQIHQKLYQCCEQYSAKIDKIAYCPHKPDDNCYCRKPKPGLLLQLADYYKVDLINVYMVGDRERDIAAAISAGAKPVWVRSGHPINKSLMLNMRNVPIYDNLASFVEDLLLKHH